jgi:proteic killer suppression protein
MIGSWKNQASRRIWEGTATNRFRGLDVAAAEDMLAALNAAKSPNDLGALKSTGLHKLKGNRRGQWAITVNDRWRICFVFKNGDALDVEITDYHTG